MREILGKALAGLSGRASLTEDSMDMPPFGQVLVLRRPRGGASLKTNAVGDRLKKYIDGGMPFVGILVDLGATDYRFSSEDLGGVASSIAAWVRGWVAPCAIVLNGTPATDLRKLLDLTKLSSIQQLQVVSNVDDGAAHIRRHLEQRAV